MLRRGPSYSQILPEVEAIAVRAINEQLKVEANDGWLGIRRDAISGILRVPSHNRLIDGVCGERLPTIDFPHVDLPRGEQRPEQHRSSIGRRQHGRGFDPSLELLMQTLTYAPVSLFFRSAASCGERHPRRPSRSLFSHLAIGSAAGGESEEAVAGLLQAVGDGGR
jgi:hypothetical protein